jgi:hypothetical protein
VATASTQALLDPWAPRALEDTHEQWTRVALRVDGDLGPGTAFVELGLRHVALAGGTGAESAIELWPGDSGWQGPVGAAWLKAGVLTTPVGQLQALSPLDVLTGRDLRPGLSLAPADLRVPAPAVVLELGAHNVLSLIWLPLGARDLVPLAGTDTSLLRQDVLAEARENTLLVNIDTAAQIEALSPQTRRGLEFALNEAGRPTPLAQTHDVALRARLDLGAVDLEGMAATLRSRRPGIDTLPEEEGGGIVLVWPRTAVVGAGLSRPVGEAALIKAEGAWTSDRMVQCRNLQVKTMPMLSGALGAERMVGGGKGVVGLEARVEHLAELEADQALLTLPTDVQIAAYAQLTGPRERGRLELGGLGSPIFEEFALRPGARWLLRDGLWIEGGGLFAIGAQSPPQTLKDVAGYEGGPISAIADTDHVRLGLSWAR